MTVVAIPRVPAKPRTKDEANRGYGIILALCAMLAEELGAPVIDCSVLDGFVADQHD